MLRALLLSIFLVAGVGVTSVYDFKVPGLDGKTIDLAKFKGKKLLIVNTASKCGFTPQYADLEKLYDKYKDKLVIVGFPANDFGGQEPGTNSEISEFCKKNYGVTFPMAAKVDVVDPVIDAASNTFRVRLVLPNPGNAIPAGVRSNGSIAPNIKRPSRICSASTSTSTRFCRRTRSAKASTTSPTSRRSRRR